MADLKELFRKNVEDYRNAFNYLLRKLEKIEENHLQKIEKDIVKHFEACKNLDTFPEPQTCLDIFNEMNPNYSK